MADIIKFHLILELESLVIGSLIMSKVVTTFSAYLILELESLVIGSKKP